jgi:hypothetical protein
MIRLSRDRTRIPAAFSGAARLPQLMKLLTVPVGGREFESTYWKKAKNQLKKETEGKCAYCEAPTAVAAHGDVEHFRPKKYYWWLAYCYDNYLFSCQLCNQSFKSDQFPLADESRKWQEPGPLPAVGSPAAELSSFVSDFSPDPADPVAIAKLIASYRAEGPNLIDPYLDDPADFFGWKPDGVKKTVELIPKSTDNDHQRLTLAAVTCYGLNRPELLAERWKTYRILLTTVNAINSGNLPPDLETDSRDLIREMISNAGPYAGMCRFFLKQWNFTP